MLVLVGDLLLGQHPRQSDRLPHLLEVGRAPVAGREVRLDPATLLRRELDAYLRTGSEDA